MRGSLIELLTRLGQDVVDVGGHGSEPVDYPDIAALVGQKVSTGDVDRGILICGTGLGMCIAANKIAGVRAAPCHDDVTAELSRRHNDLNVLCLSGDMLGDRLVGRIDLKSDRANSKLLVPAAHLEPGIEACDVAAPMREELRLMADWLGLEGLALPRDGDLGREWRRMDT